MAKSGLNGLTKTISLEGAKFNILANSISQGFTLTELTDRSLSADEKKILALQIPLLRFAKPVEIANLILFLAGPQNTYITGQNIAIDGGFTIIIKFFSKNQKNFKFEFSNSIDKSLSFELQQACVIFIDENVFNLLDINTQKRQ